MTTLTPEQIEFALKEMQVLKMCDWGGAVGIAIIALETCREYAPVIELMNQHMEEVERRIMDGDPNGLEPIGMFAGGGGR